MECGCNRNCTDCLGMLCARRIPVFASLGRAQLEKLAGLIARRSYAKGEAVYEEGDRPGFVAIVSGGSAKACIFTPDGREQILYVFSVGDFFGEQNLLSDMPSSYRVEALEQLSLCLLRKEDFHLLLRRHPDIGVAVIGELGRRLKRLESTARHMGVRSLEARIGAALLEMAGKYGVDTPEGMLVRLPLSREGLASYIGIARETVSRKLGALEEARVIRPVGSRELLITDLHALEEAAGIGFSAGSF